MIINYNIYGDEACIIRSRLTVSWGAAYAPLRPEFRNLNISKRTGRMQFFLTTEEVTAMIWQDRSCGSAEGSPNIPHGQAGIF